MRAASTPEGYHSLTPILIVEDVRAAVDFYAEAFDAEITIQREIEGRLLLADILIGDSHVQVSDKENHGGKPHGRAESCGLRLYAKNADATVKRAIAAGARQVSAVEDQFYGDRLGEILDPFGFTWRISQHIKDLDSASIERRMHETQGF